MLQPTGSGSIFTTLLKPLLLKSPRADLFLAKSLVSILVLRLLNYWQDCLFPPTPENALFVWLRSTTFLAFPLPPQRVLSPLFCMSFVLCLFFKWWCSQAPVLVPLFFSSISNTQQAWSHPFPSFSYHLYAGDSQLWPQRAETISQSLCLWYHPFSACLCPNC